MKKRIFYSITLVTLGSMLVLSILLLMFMHGRFFHQEKANIQDETHYMSHMINQYGEDDRGYMNDFITTSRVTLIEKSGDVLFDNTKNIAQMENHLNRPEIEMAMVDGKAESIRMSSTLGKQTYYYAVELAGGDILRLAVTVDSIYGLTIEALP